MKLKNFARKAFDLGARLKLTDMELLLNNSLSLKAQIERRDISLKLDEGIFTAGVRVIREGRLGYVPMTEPDIGVLRAGIEASLADAGPSPVDSFAVISAPTTGLKLHDPKVARLASSPARVRQKCSDRSRLL